MSDDANLATDAAIAMHRMGVFRRRPTEVEAVQLSWATWGAVCDFVGDAINLNNPGRNIPPDEASDTLGEPGPEYIAIDLPTAHGDMATFRHGDWILRDRDPGTFYPCKPDVFDATYEWIGDKL